MKIKATRVEAETVKGAIAEIESMDDVMQYIRAHNLCAHDVIEGAAEHIVMTGLDANI